MPWHSRMHEVVLDLICKGVNMNEHMLNYPAYVGWDVTAKCNHNCFYCYNYWRTEEAEAPGRESNGYAQIADFILSKKPVAVILSGGEPLLVFDQIREHIVRFHESGICVRILTNGSLITEDIASFFKEHQVNLMTSFPSVSEDTFEKATNNFYTYDSVVQGMDHLFKHGVSFTPNIVVSKLNLDEIERTAQWLIDRYHCKKLFISRVTRPANAASQFDRYKLSKEDLIFLFKVCEQLRKRNKIYISACGGLPFCIFPSATSLKMFGKSCHAGINGYNVDMDGNVRACTKDSKSLGNIFTDDFLSIRQKLISWGEHKEIPEKCRDCKIVNACGGGCRMTNLDDQRSGKAVDCDADPAKAPKALPRTYRIILPWKKYSIPPNIRVVIFKNIYRISYAHHILYLDKRRADLIHRSKEISVLSIMCDLRISYFGAKKFIMQMLCSEIIRP